MLSPSSHGPRAGAIVSSLQIHNKLYFGSLCRALSCGVSGLGHDSKQACGAVGERCGTMSSATSSQLRLLSDLKAIKQEPPEGCVATACMQTCMHARHRPHGVCNSSSNRRCADLARPPCPRYCIHDRCSASPVSEDNLYIWNASIFGPEDTAWEGGIYSLRLQFPDAYPSKPPRVRFTCELFHPNVYSDGSLCLDLLQDKWSPCNTICTLLMSIQSLLTDPNCASPANAEAAQLYIKDPAAYNRRVRQIAQRSLDSC